MIRFSGLLLALMFTVTPTVDMVCRAMCTPQLMAAAAPSCHEVASPTADGTLLPGMACQRDAAVAVAPADGARNVVAPAPRMTALVATFTPRPAPTSADLRRQATLPHPHGYPSTVVLRI